MTHILRIDSSARVEGSYGRVAADALIEKLMHAHPGAAITLRDVGRDSIAHVNADWVAAGFTPDADRTAEHRAALSVSDSLVGEVKAADILVIACPIYNFSVPASLKAWIDQICRAGVTFQYSPTGPIGLLEGKKAYIVITSGGTEMDGPADFATGYLRHVLGFIGITDVTVIASDRLMVDEEAAKARALADIDAI